MEFLLFFMFLHIVYKVKIQSELLSKGDFSSFEELVSQNRFWEEKIKRTKPNKYTLLHLQAMRFRP